MMRFFLIGFVFLSGCTAQQEYAQRRYFWPPLPDNPRIEFLSAYAGDNFPKKGMERIIEMFAGSEPPVRFKKPWGIASDGSGKVYVVDTNQAAVLVFDMRLEKVGLLGENRSSGFFVAPVGIALDSKGNAYVSDPKQASIFVFSPDGDGILAIHDKNLLEWPSGMAIDDKRGRLYVADAKMHRVAVFDLTGNFLFSFGHRGEGDGEFNYPVDLDIDSEGNIVIADSMNARIQIVSPEGGWIRKLGQRGDRQEDFQVIRGVAVDKDDNIYVVDARLDKILIFNKMGLPLMSLGGPSSTAETGRLDPGGFFLPQDIDIDKNNEIYVVDSMNKRFQVFKIIDDKWLKGRPIK